MGPFVQMNLGAFLQSTNRHSNTAQGDKFMKVFEVEDHIHEY